MKKKEFNFQEAAAVGARNANIKVSVTSRLDPDVVFWLKGQSEEKGIPYQTLMNSILKEAMTGAKNVDIEIIRKVIREELDKKLAG